MPDEKKIKKEIHLKKISLKDIKAEYRTFVEYNIPVWRKNAAGKWVTFPLQKIEYFLGEGDSGRRDFYVESSWQDRIKTGIDIKQVQERVSDAEAETPQHKISGADESHEGPDLGFKEALDRFHAMQTSQREDIISRHVKSLKGRFEANFELDNESVGCIINAASDAYFAVKATLEDNIEEVGKISQAHMHRIVEKTTLLIESITNILRQNQNTSSYLQLLDQKSSGSTIDHMNNVLLRFIPFCLYYNSFFSKGLIAKLRVLLRKKMESLYRHLLPAGNISLESVFQGGMRVISDAEIHEYALGALMHDIGKLYDIDYFEGAYAYNRGIIIKHVPTSYNMIVKSKEFPISVPTIAALHHEYYGDKSGYGMTAAMFPGTMLKKAELKHCISYDIDSVKNGIALAYFPAKLLEIVDVYEALTDKKRRYRLKEHSGPEAIEIMSEEFILKRLKIDPILFALFVDFLLVHSGIENTMALDYCLIR